MNQDMIPTFQEERQSFEYDDYHSHQPVEEFDEVEEFNIVKANWDAIKRWGIAVDEETPNLQTIDDLGVNVREEMYL